jgi:hypothetical protein
MDGLPNGIRKAQIYFLGTKVLLTENNIPILDQYSIEQLESE